MTAREHKSIGYYLRQVCTCKPKNLLGLGVFLLVFYFCTGRRSVTFRDTNFDYLLFTQRWLPSACIQYIERPSTFSRRCTLPIDSKMWAIHGLWPTKNNEMGPFFCNTSLPFNLQALESIQSDLIASWPNIEGDRDFSSLWRHEWEKHGTCAAQLHSLNTELKYFSTTLKFYKMYHIGNILKRNNIVPSLSKGYSLTDLFNIFQKNFGKIPQIHCIFETHTNQPYLFEIRMCFNDDLNLIDCPGDINKFKRFVSLTNCPRNRPIIYPDTSVPPAYSNGYLKNSNEDFHKQLFDILQLVKFIQWILL